MPQPNTSTEPQFTASAGKIFEGGIHVGNYKRVRGTYSLWCFKAKFFSQRAAGRFDSWCDTNGTTDCIEAMTGINVLTGKQYK